MKTEASFFSRFVLPLQTLLILAAIAAPAIAQEKIAVVVTGIGETAGAAEKDALRRAVRSAVGSYVDSETLVENDKLIRDRVLESSGSYVTSYKMIGAPVKRNGLVEVEIQAIVEGGQVAKTLEEANLVQRGVSTKGIVAEIEGKITNAREGSKILQRNLPKDLLQKLLVARLVDAEGEPTDKIEPKRKVLADGTVQTTWMVQTYFDTNKFYKEFVPPLHRMLAGISTASGGPVISTAKEVAELPLSGYPIHFNRKWQGPAPKQPAGDQPHCYMLLSTGRSAAGGAERFNWYLLEGASYIKALQKINMQVDYAKVQLQADFLAADGGVVASTSFSPWDEVHWANRYGLAATESPVPPFFLNISASISGLNKDKPQAQHMIISPRFAPDTSGGTLPMYASRGGYPDASSGACDVLLRPFSVTLAPEDLRRIVNIRFFFTMKESL